MESWDHTPGFHLMVDKLMCDVSVSMISSLFNHVKNGEATTKGQKQVKSVLATILFGSAPHFPGYFAGQLPASFICAA